MNTPVPDPKTRKAKALPALDIKQHKSNGPKHNQDQHDRDDRGMETDDVEYPILLWGFGNLGRMRKLWPIPALKEFDPSQIPIDATILLAGKRRTGKSFALRYLMWTMAREFYGGVVISKTNKLNHFWEQFLPKEFIHNKYDRRIIDNVFKRQESIINDPDMPKKEKEQKLKFFILLDDIIGTKDLRYDEEFEDIYTLGRHYHVCLFITSQYARAFNPTIRGNFDYCFMFKSRSHKQREALYEEWAEVMPKDAFLATLDFYAQDNRCLVADTAVENATVMDSLYHFKAIDPGPFHLGSREYWDEAARIRESENSRGDRLLKRYNIF